MCSRHQRLQTTWRRQSNHERAHTDNALSHSFQQHLNQSVLCESLSSSLSSMEVDCKAKHQIV